MLASSRSSWLLCGALLFSSLPAAAQRRAAIDRSASTDPGGSFLDDPHQNGEASELRVAELRWGRLVDVHDLVRGRRSERARFADFLIGESIQSDGADYELEADPVTGKTRLTILRPAGAAFDALLAAAEEATVPIATKGPNSPAPFSEVPRNGALSIRFDDLLQDDDVAAVALSSTVRARVGDVLTDPFSARVLFDAHHGGSPAGAGSTRGQRHATRVLVDWTVSAVEAAGMPVPAPLNEVGLPSSRATASGANVLLALPTRVDPSTGQFAVLTNLAGNPLATTGNGPVDASNQDVVRALRSGNDGGVYGGFLLDTQAPQLVGQWPLEILRATGAGRRGTSPDEFVLRVSFPTPCRRVLEPGHVIQAGPTFLEVLTRSAAPDASGTVDRVRVSVLAGATPTPQDLLGGARYTHAYTAGLRVPAACWFEATPSARGGLLSTASSFRARFSEPVAPDASAADDFRLLVGGLETTPTAENTVVARVVPGADLRALALVPVLPLDHKQGESESFLLELVADGITDLAGNELLAVAPPVVYRIDPMEPTLGTGGITLRFAEADEVAPEGDDVRGQVFYDLAEGELRPRPVTRWSAGIDDSAPVQSLMIPLPTGVQTPLNPLGAKLQNVWRYADLGWRVEDESYHNVDVEGLSWSPRFGQVVRDFFEEFEIRLGHSSRLPDEQLDQNLLPRYRNSGLKSAPDPFSDNVLDSEQAAQTVVHPRALGYVVDPADVVLSPTGTPLIPYPLNRSGGPYRSYTWRDTSAVEVGGEFGAGVPMDVETGSPLFLYGGGEAGSLYSTAAVKTIGLPLLMEFRCFPSDTGIGLNALNVALAINSSARPNFRAFSAGGVDASGAVVRKDPDLEPIPTGGFQPGSFPPGAPTQPADNLSYRGQLDLVVRVSRAHTAWLDAGSRETRFFPAVLEAETPDGTRIRVDYRGAERIRRIGPFKAERLDAYGDFLRADAVDFFGGDAGWTADVGSLDGARFLQLRLTFVNDLERSTTATLRTLGLPFQTSP